MRTYQIHDLVTLNQMVPDEKLSIGEIWQKSTGLILFLWKETAFWNEGDDELYPDWSRIRRCSWRKYREKDYNSYSLPVVVPKKYLTPDIQIMRCDMSSHFFTFGNVFIISKVVQQRNEKRFSWVISLRIYIKLGRRQVEGIIVCSFFSNLNEKFFIVNESMFIQGNKGTIQFILSLTL